MIGGISLLLLVVFIVYLRINFASIKGRVGEAYVNKILSNLNEIEYKVFHDVYVPNKDGGTTQVDHIVTSAYGIFVIETKHYEGWIFGKEDQKHWTQVIYKRKEKMFNPIWQNYGHVSALKTHLDLEHNINSIIAFSNNSTLKFEDNFKGAHVIQFNQLLRVIREYKTLVFSYPELLEMNSRIEKLSSVAGKEKRQIKKEHLESINRKKQQSNVSQKNSCPKCGSNLVMRQGKFGNFQGCSQYPKCRYTKQISS